MIALLLFTPFLGFLINAFRFKAGSSKLSGWIGTGACFLAFLHALFCFLHYDSILQLNLGQWISVENLQIPFSFVLDPLSLVMILLITGVGTLIHLYSMAYMSRDRGMTRYFAYLNLFVFMMLILVLADNLLLLFVGWEGVGLCSYLLIGFWFRDAQKVYSGMKAFIVNRIGDACFLLGMFLLFFHFENLNFSELNQQFLGLQFAGFLNPATLGGLFLFLGATGKSAQAPLSIWLSDAMAGPTPVSALIHAATMVTAGIYMIVRLFGLYSASPDLLLLIGWIGACTSLGAALIATRQWDFKKILAYSTISQLGYMFMSLGVVAFSASIFHLLTHGFFKALLFLCAGSVIHGLSGEQDIRNMGGLKTKLPITFLTYMVGALALMALPPFSGFFSKDQILHSLFSSEQYMLYGVALVGAFCTAFYMTRLTIFVFFGKKKFKGSAHEASFAMWLPLVILAILTLLSGLLGIPHIFSEFLPAHPPHFLEQFLQDFTVKQFHTSVSTEIILMSVSVLGSLLTIGFTFYFLRKKTFNNSFQSFKEWMENSFYIGQFLNQYVYPSFFKVTHACSQTVDEFLFQGGVRFIVKQVTYIKKQFSIWQNGNLQSYMLFFVWGLSLCLFLVLWR